LFFFFSVTVLCEIYSFFGVILLCVVLWFYGVMILCIVQCSDGVMILCIVQCSDGVMILCIVHCSDGVMILCIVQCSDGVTSQETVLLLHIASYFVQLRGELNVLLFFQSFEEIQNSQYVRKTQSLFSMARIIWDKTHHRSSSSQCLEGL
jgi:hypothetical protein